MVNFLWIMHPNYYLYNKGYVRNDMKTKMLHVLVPQHGTWYIQIGEYHKLQKLIFEYEVLSSSNFQGACIRGTSLSLQEFTFICATNNRWIAFSLFSQHRWVITTQSKWYESSELNSFLLHSLVNSHSLVFGQPGCHIHPLNDYWQGALMNSLITGKMLNQ